MSYLVTTYHWLLLTRPPGGRSWVPRDTLERVLIHGHVASLAYDP